MSNLQERAKAARKSKRLSQSELAEKIGVATSTISAIESGRSESNETILSIAAALEVPSEWLMTGEGETPRGVMLKAAPALETNVWKDALVSEMREEINYLREALKLALGGKPSNFPTLIKQMPAVSPMRIAA